MIRRCVVAYFLTGCSIAGVRRALWNAVGIRRRFALTPRELSIRLRLLLPKEG